MPTLSRLAGLALASAAALTLSARPCAAQQDTVPPQTPPAPAYVKNAIYVELGGNALLFSVNYDRRIGDWAGRVGVQFLGAGYDDEGDDDTSVLVVPVTVSYLAGRGNGRAEIGLGVGISRGNLDFGSLGEADIDGVYGTGILGYRYQRPEGGLLVRAGFTPVLIDEEFWPWFGFSVGFGF
ncbi:MAG TPA: hypothetical protein VHG91_06200 [Longimicrobium sp.]|nr:hypothetical protein [Longimicrobium sp.]